MPTAKGGYKFSDGTKAPGVTTILESLGWGKEALMWWAWDLGRQGFAYKDLRKQAANIGTIAHERVEHHLLGKPWVAKEEYDPQDIVASDEPFEKYLEWRKGYDIEIVLSEKNLVSDKLGYGATPDFLAKMRKAGSDDPWRLVLIDLKTSKAIYPSHIAQVAAYADLIETVEPDLVSANSDNWCIDDCLILRVGKDDTEFESRIIPQDDLTDGYGIFKALVPIHAQKARFEKAYASKKAKKATEPEETPE